MNANMLGLNPSFFQYLEYLHTLSEPQLLFTAANSPAVFGLCETHTFLEIPDSLFCSSIYKAFRKDRRLCLKVVLHNNFITVLLLLKFPHCVI